MRIKLFIPLAGAVALTAVCVVAAGATPTPPAILAKQAQANRVLNQIAAIDERLNSVSEQFDGARVRLEALQRNLKAERAALVRAKAHYAQAQTRAAKLLVWLYTSNKSSSLDVILGAHSLSEMLTLSDAENAISKQTTTIAHETKSAKLQLQGTVRALDRDRKAAQATVTELAQRRREIMRGLNQRRRLLASVQAEVARLQAAERARQARLAAEAKARLEAELAARAKAEAEAKAKAEAAAAAKAKAAAAAAAAAATRTTSDQATSTTTATTTTTDTTTALTTTTTPVFTPSVTPAASLPAGHPETASLALQYLGIPYLWGGSSPSGFDCSGLVTYVFAQIGISLPHFAAAQWTFGVPVGVSQLQPGDLVFFDALDHVGIYLGNNQFIDAPHTGAFVRIDTLDEPWYAKHYVGARRI